MKNLIKNIILCISIAVTTSSLMANEYSCVSKDGQELNFKIDTSREKINFTNVEYLGYAQILTNHDFSYLSSANVLSFEYDWYYTASYELRFTKPLSQHQIGVKQQMYLTFDDSDGAWEDNVEFLCSVSDL